jgi:hypothetical protein
MTTVQPGAAHTGLATAPCLIVVSEPLPWSVAGIGVWDGP